jgi:serine/threonine protein kinase
MARHGDQHPDPVEGSPIEQRLGELINDFFDRKQAGENVSPEQFLAENPEHAEQLREHLRGLELIGNIGSRTDRSTLINPTPVFGGSSARTSLDSNATPLPQIAGYEILKQIGRGGMGIVYKAVQSSTKRVVALKVLLEGPFATDVARKRFEREISLAAQLNHPNIIPIYDSGKFDGRMYYAMEHIFGLSLSDHFRAHPLTIEQRIRLFIKICHAISHAHQRGVIHRDLKPSNILVDGAGEPHILDFGLAKAGTFIDVNTSVSAQIVGTPAYMSPEQASGDPTGVDIRADIYGLGVILYETLTGNMPYDTNVSMGKVLDNIANAEPAQPKKLNSKLDSEVSAIVLKALEKKKENRYQAVDTFCLDLQKYLAGEPISVARASGIYLLKKAIRKHRTAIAIVTVAVMLTAGGVFTIRHFSRKLIEKDRELTQLASQSEAKVRELRQQNDDSDRRAKEAERLLSSLDPTARKFVELTADQISGQGAASVTGLLQDAIVKISEATEPEQKKLIEAPLTPPAISPRPEWVDTSGRKKLTQEEFDKAYAKFKDAMWRNYQAQITAPPAASQPTSAPAAPTSAPAPPPQTPL